MPKPEQCNGLDDDCNGVTDEVEGCCRPGPINPEAAPEDRWVLVCPGSFVMGSPGPECPGSDCRDPRCATEEGCPGPETGRALDERQHEVTLTRPFLIQATEVTQAQWLRMRWQGEQIGPRQPCPSDAMCDRLPVTWFNSYEMLLYLNWLSEQDVLDPCYDLGSCTKDERGIIECEKAVATFLPFQSCPGYRVPTEAEWEYAARAGTITAFPTGGISPEASEIEPNETCSHREPNLDRIGWYIGNMEDGVFINDVTTVAQKEPNPWGLFDILGNVAEDCADDYRCAYPADSVTDPLSKDVGRAADFASGIERSWGCWLDNRSASRSIGRWIPVDVRYLVGLRPVRSVGGVGSPMPCAPGTSRPCGPATGQCVPGAQTCQPDGTWGPCTGQQGQAAELVDRVDNDCDGLTDEEGPIDPFAPPDEQWVRVRGGIFEMGLDGPWPPYVVDDLNCMDGFCSHNAPAHEVLVPTFEMAQSEVTVRWYRQCVQAGACRGDCPGLPEEPDLPAPCLSWEQANELAAWVGGGARLCSEAEWEYAARSEGQCYERGHPFTFPWGADPPGWADGCPLGEYRPVCFAPRTNSEQGICDLIGNEWEWVADVYHVSYLGAPADGSAWMGEPEEGPMRHVIRGGGCSRWIDELSSFSREPGGLRAAVRLCRDPQ